MKSVVYGKFKSSALTCEKRLFLPLPKTRSFTLELISGWHMKFDFISTLEMKRAKFYQSFYERKIKVKTI